MAGTGDGLTAAHTALRIDFHAAIAEGVTAGVAPAVIAARCVHLVVLHGLLPETEPGIRESDGDVRK